MTTVSADTLFPSIIKHPQTADGPLIKVIVARVSLRVLYRIIPVEALARPRETSPRFCQIGLSQTDRLLRVFASLSHLYPCPLDELLKWIF